MIFKNLVGVVGVGIFGGLEDYIVMVCSKDG